MAAGLHGQQPAARREIARQRREHRARLELGRHARAPRLRGEDQVVAFQHLAGPRDDAVEQEFMILAVDHQHRRPRIDRIAGLRAGPRLPAMRQHRAQRLDLLGVFMGGVAGEPQLLPVHRGAGLQVVRAPGAAHRRSSGWKSPAPWPDVRRNGPASSPGPRRTSSRLISLATTDIGTVGNRWWMLRIRRASTVPSPMPASNTRSAGGVGRDLLQLQRGAMRHCRLLVAGVDEGEYFWRLS